MSPHAGTRTTPSFTRSLFQRLVALSVAVALPAQAIAAAVELATTPMANSATTTVKPNLMFVLDDSGSMDWDYMPDASKNFANQYGFNTSQCNGLYYNPNVTYTPPVKADGTPLNATATSFTAAYKDGFNTGAGTVNLNTAFTGGTMAGVTGISLSPGNAFYYTYSGSQTTPALQNYFNTSSTFYQECNSAIGSTPGSNVFSLVTLASSSTATLTVSVAGGTITVNTGGSNTSVSSVKVTIGSPTTREILSATTAKSTNSSTLAANIAAGINNCTAGATGNCQVGGFSASATGNVVTIFPAVGSLPDGGTNPAVTNSQGTGTYTYTAFPTPINTVVTSIRVGSTELLSGNANGSSRPNLASSIQSKITAAGYSATVSGNIVTITAPTSAAGLTPVVTVTAGGAGTLLVTPSGPFPDSTAAKLQNFANWFSYYSTRMNMMKSAGGIAFQNVTDAFRVGFATMNNNVSPGFLSVDTFSGTQKTNFYSKLYASNPGNSTPLREILSRVGQYYAHKFGAVDKYTATITVGGSGSTSVDSILVGTTELMNASSTPDTSTSNVAKNVSDQINAPVSTDYGASKNNNVITITGPASALGQSPVVSKTGTMTFGVTAFVKTTTTATFNGVTPPDPVQYSCQQNFTILSTDGYWNGPNTYDLNNAAVGEVDGVGVPRPYNDGQQASTTWTNTYSRTSYGRASSSGSCSSGRPETQTPQTGSCTVTTAGASCTPGSWTNGTTTNVSPQTCIASNQIPSATLPVLVSSNSNTVNTGGTSDTLADVALYYYQTDLRDNSLANCTGALGTSVCENNVFVTPTDNQTQQHMTTFTLGLGVRGRMVYSSSYLTDTSGDFVSVKLGSTASSTVCTWQASGTVCNWPAPTSGSIETTDDLWHAAVNGRGAYFSATDPTSLANGLANALVSIKSKVGAAAAAATSTLNPVAGNNQAFVASYTTQKWTGNLEARGINTDTGAVNENANWCVENVTAGTCQSPGAIITETAGDTTTYFCSTPNSVTCPDGVLDGTDCKVPVATSCTGTMNSMVTDTSDTRTIYTANDAGTALTAFNTTYRAGHASYFDSTKASQLSQWSTFTSAQQTAAQGDNLLNYLRGQWGHEYDRSTVATVDQLFRKRDAVTGDALESQPAFIAGPIFSYPYPGYAEYKAAQASRAGTVYMGTNDGMLHAFASDTGIERWAYIPSMVVQNMWKLADKSYADLHTNFVNGSPITQDVCVARCSNTVTGVAANDPVWKTILVAGLNAGGRGYFALDITNPASPTLLWEFTHSSGTGVVKDKDMGYSFAQPVVTRKSDGTWVVVVTSGYDNGTDSATKVSGSFVANPTPNGDGGGYVYVLNAGTGAMISKIATGVGTASNPSGLGKIAGFNAEPGGNRASYLYGGDLLGNVWRFDINNGTAQVGTGTAFKFATLFSDTAGTLPQPIMTTPLLGTILGKRIVFIGTGKYLEVPDLTNTQLMSQYAIKDDDATATLVNPRVTSTSNMVQQFLINNPNGSATRLSAATATATVTGNNAVDFGINRGWFVDFPDSRERVNIDAKLIEGTLIVPSIVPSSTECAPGGTGWLNFFDYKTGAAVVPQPGIASVKYDSTIVGINVLFIAGNPVVEVVTSTNPTPTIEPNVQFGASAATFAGKRVLWRELVP